MNKSFLGQGVERSFLDKLGKLGGHEVWEFMCETLCIEKKTPWRKRQDVLVPKLFF